MTEQQEESKVEKEFGFMPEGMGEAGGVAFAQIRHIREVDGGTEVLEVNLTGRGRNTREAFENLGDCLKYAQGKGWSAYRKVNELPHSSAAQKPALVLPTKAQVAGPASPIKTVATSAVSASGSPANYSSGVYHVTKLEVTPRADGKVTLGFFEAGHKWADITKVCTVDVAISTLAPLGDFTEEHLRVAAVFDDILATIRWIDSENLNSKGKPYKNIVEIIAG